MLFQIVGESELFATIIAVYLIYRTPVIPFNPARNPFEPLKNIAFVRNRQNVLVA